jgi:hypothetical protein
MGAHTAGHIRARLARIGCTLAGSAPAALALGLFAVGAAAASAQTVAPLPASDYTARPACRAPAPGHAGCLAMELVARSVEARAHTHPLGMTRARPLAGTGPQNGNYGLRPADLRAAYFPGEAPEAPAAAPQTIALVDAYNDPQAAADLALYDKEFGIEPCTEASGCFAQVNQRGEHTNLPFPTSESEREAKLKVCENVRENRTRRETACALVEEAEGWAVEISTDIEMASAICQRHCRIVLVEADSDSYENLEAAEEAAVKVGREATGAGDTEVSNSWGGSEPVLDGSAFNHPGTVITASAGDEGYLNWTEAAEAAAANESYYSGADYPASSPHVVAVGGTRLAFSAGAYASESVWNDDTGGGEENYGAGGGGCSTEFTAQQWQREVPDWSRVGCENRRAVADVAADADPYTGVAVHDSVPDFHEEEVNGEFKVVNTPLGWWPIGGTSVASPIVASMYALAGGSNGVEYPAKTLYEHLGSSLLHQVSSGGNGECDDIYEESKTTHTTCAGSMEPLSARFAFDCGKTALICNAAPGYNGPAGVGTPRGVGALQPGDETEVRKRREEEAATQKAEEEARTKAEAEARRKRGEEEAARVAEEEAERAQADEEAKAKAKREAEAKAKREAEATAKHEAEALAEALAKVQQEEKPGGGLAGGGPQGTSSTGSGTSQTGSGGTHGQSGAPSHTSTGGAGSGGTAPRISRLALTARASAVIARGLPTAAQIGFAFTLSAPARVRVTLSRLTTVAGRPRWAAVAGNLTLTLSVGRGTHRAHLRGGTLPPGRYRLTLTPARGAGRSLAFRLR